LKALYSGRQVEPRGLRVSAQHRRQAGQAGVTRETIDFDHRRKQHEPIGIRRRVALDAPCHVQQRQRRAVRIPHEMDRQVAGGRAAPGFGHRHVDRRVPCLAPFTRESGRHGAVPRHARHDRDEAVLPIQLRQAAHAVRRIGEPMQHHRHADGRTGRFEHVRAIPVAPVGHRRNPARVVVAIQRRAIARVHRRLQAAMQAVEHRVLGRDPGLPILVPDRARGLFLRHDRVPRPQRRPAGGKVGAADDDRHQHQQDDQEGFAQQRHDRADQAPGERRHRSIVHGGPDPW
jgi:hypothetical protein